MCQLSGEGDRGGHALTQSSPQSPAKSSCGGAQVKAKTIKTTGFSGANAKEELC